MSGKPYIERDEPSDFALAQSDNPERVRAFSAVTLERAQAVCDELRDSIGAPRAFVHVTIGSGRERLSLFVAAGTDSSAPATSFYGNDLCALIEGARAWIADYHAQTKERARKALAEARAAAELLGIVEVV